MARTAILLPFMERDEVSALYQTGNFQDTTEHDLLHLWHQALQQAVPDWVPSPEPFLTLPHGAELLAENYRNSPAWRHYVDDDFQFVMVKASDIATFQYRLNWSTVEAMAAVAPAPGDMEGLFRFCFPQSSLAMPLCEGNAALFSAPTPGAFSVQLPAECRRLHSSALEVVVTVSARPNFLQITLLENRLVLVNGNHRVAALLRRGHEYIPALLQVQAPSAGFLGFDPPMTFPPERLSAERPPLVADYLRDGLASLLESADVIECLQVLFHSEDILLPALENR